jgi:predicted RNA-binding Zn-ribbon protein involved in translation (DUF1610 family)
MTDTDRAIAAYALWRRERVLRWASSIVSWLSVLVVLSVVWLKLGWVFLTLVVIYIGVKIAVGIAYVRTLKQARRAFTALAVLPCPTCGYPQTPSAEPGAHSPDASRRCPECGKVHRDRWVRVYWQQALNRT